MPTFISNPTNSDKNLLGWNSRYIYIYASENVKVNETVTENEVFQRISDTQKKGSVNLKENYFFCDDGNSFKITMYFLASLDGSTLRIDTGLKNNNGTEYVVSTKSGDFHTLPIRVGVKKLFKYEVVMTKYKPSTQNPILLINGSIIYSREAGGNDADVSFIEQYGKIQFPQNMTSKLIIKIMGTLAINVLNVTIEEIK
jgi:hypothetical protein